MTILRFFTDPHIGRELKSNTTPVSRANLQSQLHLYALQAAQMPHPAGLKVTATVCAGDLFDTDHNPEHILLQGAQVAKACDALLGGNHDVVNIVGRESSLSALAALMGGDTIVMPAEPGLSKSHVKTFGDVSVWMIPHHATQAEFDKALMAAAKAVQAGKAAAKRHLLLVHCNYHLTMGVSENDLNLMDATARLLLDTFDFIVMGHDHRARRESHEGRVIVLGNTHPTSFSDLGEKFVWFYDSEDNTFTQEQNCADTHLAMPASDLIQLWRDGELAKLGEVEWLDLTGSLPPEAAVDLAKAIRGLWRVVPFVYAIRASKVSFSAAGLEAGVSVEVATRSLIELIEAELSATPEMLELFQEAKVGDE